MFYLRLFIRGENCSNIALCMAIVWFISHILFLRNVVRRRPWQSINQYITVIGTRPNATSENISAATSIRDGINTRGESPSFGHRRKFTRRSFRALISHASEIAWHLLRQFWQREILLRRPKISGLTRYIFQPHCPNHEATRLARSPPCTLRK